MKRPTVLTIAGSDPSGGAGIQSDLRTFDRLGCNGISVITALTAQNTFGVQSVNPVDPDVLSAQLTVLLDDIRPDAVKIGLLATRTQVEIVAELVERYDLQNVVLDPILSSTAGTPFLDREGIKALIEHLFSHCALISPNLHEAEFIGGLKPDAAPAPILIKGGHKDGSPADTLHTPDGGVYTFEGRRVDTPHTHGTGCFLSSAIASYLALGNTLYDSIRMAKKAMEQALHTPVAQGGGRGFPSLPAGVSAYRNLTDRIKGINMVTDSQLRPDVAIEYMVEQALIGGAQVIQLREKNKPIQEMVAAAKGVRELTTEYNAVFIVNDRVDVAMASDADGVHVGADDMRPADARRILGPGRIIGVSVNTVDAAEEAAEYADYFGVGTIYSTSTKADAGEPVGPERIREIAAAFPRHPIVAIGGIDKNNISEVAKAGAHSAAIISAIVTAPDIAQATRELAEAFT